MFLKKIINTSLVKIDRRFLFLMIALSLVLRILTLKTHGFWVDEARQFWVSQGLSAFRIIQGGPFDARWVSLFEDSSTHFLGSPIFTLMIHYWSKISCAELWLRVLPLVFAIGVLPIMYRIARLCSFSKTTALFITTFCSWNAAWVYYSIELRPYSFEIFCTALTFLLFLRLSANPNVSVLRYMWLALSMILGIFSGYGYGFYVPFVATYAIYFLRINSGRPNANIIGKVLIILAPVFIYFSYMYYFLFIMRTSTGQELSFPRVYNLTSCYLPFLHTSIHDDLWLYGGSVVISIFSVILYQFFYYFRLNFDFLQYSAILKWFFSALGVALLIGIVYCMRLIFKKKNKPEGIILVALLYVLCAYVIASSMGLFPMGPIRQNLFFSPVLFMSFFIILRHDWRVLRKPKLSLNFFAMVFLYMMVMISLLRAYESTVFGRHHEEIIPALKRIEAVYRPGDSVCVFVNKRSEPVFFYEWKYARIPWVMTLQLKDIFADPAFKGGANTGYDYQWYLFASDGQLKNRIKKRLIKEGVIVDEEQVVLPRTIIFRARRRG
ncbi:MAG: hypothetical protein KBA46_01330 [Candidatus Omnitrophica bacterium]|nr:hypothetical protein [Candidatus Omnitrophota bacterium]